jgi:hypothetical protein
LEFHLPPFSCFTAFDFRTSRPPFRSYCDAGGAAGDALIADALATNVFLVGYRGPGDAGLLSFEVRVRASRNCEFTQQRGVDLFDSQMYNPLLMG